MSGVAAGGHADEPGIGIRLVTAAGSGESVVAHHLRCAGLAGEVYAVEMRNVGGADGTAGHVGHGVSNELPVFCRDRNGGFASAGEVLVDCLKQLGWNFICEDNVGTAKNASGGNALSARASWIGVHGDGALTDADGDDLACVPLFMLRFQLPCGGRHGAGDLVGQVDSGLLTDADRGGVLRDGVDAKAVGEGVVVEGVAGVRDGVG